MGDENKKGSIKAIILGETQVGKTALINRIKDNKFETGYISTSAPSQNEISLEIKEETIKITFWDTAGQEKFRSLNKLFYKNAEIVLLVYSIDNRTSFEELKNYWYNEVQTFCTIKSRNNFILIFSCCYCC